ncbi:Non-classical arabinogalactan protein 30 [Forsythia ovata]|uniref:Non-classical arabinogalactan protein 30 n=1 Tax=Forsythia ovata TaxID=205694 RepID=A0ABD1QF38_9LAMI
MAFGLGKVLVLLVLLCSSFTVFSDSVGIAKVPLPVHPPAPAPAPHHKGHHHHHHPTPPPSHPPVKPPSHPPVKPPTPPPVKPPSHPPVKPPSHPPAKPPSHPPAKPPSPPQVKPPSHPPAKPPTLPPSHPPIRKAVGVQGVVYCKSCKYRGIGTLLGASPLAGAVVKLQCNNTKWGLVEQTKTDKNGYFFFKPSKLTTAAFHKCKVFLISSPLVTCSVPTNLGSGASGAILIPSLKPPVKPLPFQLFTVGPFAFEPAKKVPCHH